MTETRTPSKGTEVPDGWATGGLKDPETKEDVKIRFVDVL